MKHYTPKRVSCITSKQHCPICTAQRVWRRTGTKLGVGEIFACPTCGGLFLHPPKSVKHENSGWTNLRERRWAEDVQIAIAHAPRIARWFEDTTGRRLKTVLEIGCGSGFMGVGFKRIGLNYLGTDIDTASLSIASQNGVAVINCAAEDLAAELTGTPFDLIVSSNTFEHVANLPAAFDSVGRLAFLRAVVIVPNALGLLPRLRAWSSWRVLANRWCRTSRDIAYSIDGYWHKIGLTKKALQYLSLQAGLEVVSVRSIGVNDRTFGFVQRNPSGTYRVLSSISSVLDMNSQLQLVLSGRAARGADGAQGLLPRSLAAAPSPGDNALWSTFRLSNDSS